MDEQIRERIKDLAYVTAIIMVAFLSLFGLSLSAPEVWDQLASGFRNIRKGF